MIILQTTLLFSSIDILSENNPPILDNWYIVNDGVMGGLSEGYISMTEENNLRFSGTVRLENNGGFTSLRHKVLLENLDHKNAFKLKIKGDGKRYQFRVKSQMSDYHSYKYEFDTKEDEVQEVIIPFAKMIPTFRGRQLNMENYPGDQLEEITFLIGNKKQQEFTIDIHSIAIINHK